MAERSLIPDELRRAVGIETEPVWIEIDNTAITRFFVAVEDANPLWCDEEIARIGPYEGLIAPPGLLTAVMMAGYNPLTPYIKLLPRQILDGGGEWEFLKPIRPGDKIATTGKITDLTERPGRMGHMLIVSFAWKWFNQRNETVAIGRSSTFFYS